VGRPRREPQSGSPALDRGCLPLLNRIVPLLGVVMAKVTCGTGQIKRTHEDRFPRTHVADRSDMAMRQRRRGRATTETSRRACQRCYGDLHLGDSGGSYQVAGTGLGLDDQPGTLRGPRFNVGV
jgi:hypothetical protein